MVCRQCGTGIAEKAIICYKCGTATALPASGPARRQGRSGPSKAAVWAWLLIAAAVLAGVWWQFR